MMGYCDSVKDAEPVCDAWGFPTPFHGCTKAKDHSFGKHPSHPQRKHRCLCGEEWK